MARQIAFNDDTFTSTLEPTHQTSTATWRWPALYDFDPLPTSNTLSTIRLPLNSFSKVSRASRPASQSPSQSTDLLQQYRSFSLDFYPPDDSARLVASSLVNRAGAPFFFVVSLFLHQQHVSARGIREGRRTAWIVGGSSFPSPSLTVLTTLFPFVNSKNGQFINARSKGPHPKIVISVFHG